MRQSGGTELAGRNPYRPTPAIRPCQNLPWPAMERSEWGFKAILGALVGAELLGTPLFLFAGLWGADGSVWQTLGCFLAAVVCMAATALLAVRFSPSFRRNFRDRVDLNIDPLAIGTSGRSLI